MKKFLISASLTCFAVFAINVQIVSAATFTVINTAGTGPGSLRQAIADANSTAGADIIEFNIPGGGFKTISPESSFDHITESVTIDGYSQNVFLGVAADFPIVEINGTNSTVNRSGLFIDETAPNTTIRGLVINRFDSYGIRIQGDNNVVEGCYLGIDPGGNTALPNASGNLFIFNGSSNRIGGTTTATRNVISGSNGFGLVIGANTSEGSTNNVVLGNIIGLNAAGDSKLPNKNGGINFNASFGNASDNTVGGLAAGQGNVISGNGDYSGPGISISGNDARRNTIVGNLIGLDATGILDMGNVESGVEVVSGSRDNDILSNTIAFNGEHGVVVELSASTMNKIQENSIFSNADLGIELGFDGVTPNDAGDGDAGPNNLQNFPVITVGTSDGDTTSVEGTLDGVFLTAYTFHFYHNTACDSSGNGEGQFYIGSTQATANGSGDVVFTATFPSAVPSGNVLTATTTDLDGNTSEFSLCFPIVIKTSARDVWKLYE